MRIAQIIDSMGMGGAQKLLVTFAEALPAEHELTVVELNANGHPDSQFRPQLREMGVSLIDFTANRLMNVQRMRGLFQYLKQEQFDVAHTHLTYANFMGLWLADIVGIPAVASLHNVQRSSKNQMRLKLEDWSLQNFARRIIAVGYTVAEVNQSFYPNHELVTIPNAISLLEPVADEVAAEARGALLGDEVTRPLLLSVGRLHPQKGYHLLIEAMGMLRETHPEALLCIAGDGSLRPELAAQIEQSGLSEQVRLLGAREDVPVLMAASDLLVSSSLWEGLPVVVLEAMSAGLPVVATTVGDVPRVVHEEVGLLVPPSDSAALAAAVGTLLADETRRRAMGQAAMAHVRAEYSAAVWMERLLGLYQKVIDEERGVAA